MSTFLSVRALHEEQMPKKTIARRLGVSVRIVRKHIVLCEPCHQQAESMKQELFDVQGLIQSWHQQHLSKFVMETLE